MEKFKINRFNSESQTLSLEHLNQQSHISKEQLQDVEEAHEETKKLTLSQERIQDAKKAYKETKGRARKEVLEIYEQVGKNDNTGQEAKGDILEEIEISGRDGSSVIQRQDYGEKIVYLSDYRAEFASYEGRDGFIMRADQHQTQAQLSEDIDRAKGLPRKVSFGQKLSNVMKAVGLQKAA